MSELRVDSVKSKGGGAPDLPKGVTISGITTAVTLGATTVDVSNVNVSGVVTSGTLSGSLLSTGTPTLGLGVTINSSGLHITGVATAGIVSATTLYGDGSNLTGVGASIAPLFYNPDVSDGTLEFTATGIGITFNSQIKAGTGNLTLRLVGAAGTVVENFGVGSSVTISENKVSFTPTADLASDTVYHINYPSGCFTNNEGTDYVGTAYTFNSRALRTELYTWGTNTMGQLAHNNTTNYSSPVQVPGTRWGTTTTQQGVQFHTHDAGESFATYVDLDGKLFATGRGWGYGRFAPGYSPAPNSTTYYSSPLQIGSATTWKYAVPATKNVFASKTDGTLWSWGYNEYGNLGQGSATGHGRISSPVQVPGTNWSGTYDTLWTSHYDVVWAIKTDGTLWTWGSGNAGQLGTNTTVDGYSSPMQIGSETTWSKVTELAAIKTDGTLWAWGSGFSGQLANNRSGPSAAPTGSGYWISSPIQIPGTTWRTVSARNACLLATKTDGTLWAWGQNTKGQLGLNSGTVRKSSPTQVGSDTTWDDVKLGYTSGYGIKTDGTLWAWGDNSVGELGQNSQVHYSSPVQVGSLTGWLSITGGSAAAGGLVQI